MRLLNKRSIRLIYKDWSYYNYYLSWYCSQREERIRNLAIEFSINTLMNCQKYAEEV